MNNIFEELDGIIKDKSKEKTVYRNIFGLMENTVDNYLKSVNYDYDKTINSRGVKIEPKYYLEKMKQNMNDLEHSPHYGISKYMKDFAEKVNSFFKDNYAMHAHEITVNSSGKMQVELYLMLTPGFSISKPETAKEQFAKTIEKMKEEGFLLKENNRGIYLLNCEKNISLLQGIIKEYFGVDANFETRKDVLIKMTFKFIPGNENINYRKRDDNKKTELIEENKQELSEDDFSRLRKVYNEFKDAVSGCNEYVKENNPEMIQTTAYIVESTFSEMCEIVGLENDLTKRVKERYRETREAFKKIHDVNNKIVSKLDTKTVIDSWKKVADFIEYKIEDEIPGAYSVVTMTRFGGIDVNISFGSLYSKVDGFEMDDGYNGITILSTDHNVNQFKKVMSILADGVEITRIVSRIDNGQQYISEIEFCIDDAANIKIEKMED